MELSIIDFDHRGDNGKLDFPEYTLEVKFTKRQYGGWCVVRADNGRLLGWLCKGKYDNGKPCWNAYVSSTAFLGADKDDGGDILDEVPERLFDGKDQFTSNPIAYEDNRQYAAEAIFRHLFRNQAPAVGFPRHYAVKQYERSV